MVNLVSEGRPAALEPGEIRAWEPTSQDGTRTWAFWTCKDGIVQELEGARPGLRYQAGTVLPDTRRREMGSAVLDEKSLMLDRRRS